MTTPSTLPQPETESEAYRLAEKLLSPRFLILDALAFAASRNAEGKKAAEDHKRKKDAARAELMALPIDELRARVTQQEAQSAAQRVAQVEANEKRKQEKAQREAQTAAEREARKFYNQASSVADFQYWVTMDHWTFDEAVALLMGLDPRVMTRAAMQKEIEPEFSLMLFTQPHPPKSAFVRRYEALRAVAERATAMKSAQIRPLDVLAWATASGAITPPAALVQALAARLTRNQAPTSWTVDPADNRTLQNPANTSETPKSSEGKPDTHTGTQKKWDAEALRELEAKRKVLGTKGAAKHFGITTTRVRQLLPQGTPTATAADPFNLVRKTRGTK